MKILENAFIEWDYYLTVCGAWRTVFQIVQSAFLQEAYLILPYKGKMP